MAAVASRGVAQSLQEREQTRIGHLPRGVQELGAEIQPAGVGEPVDQRLHSVLVAMGGQRAQRLDGGFCVLVGYELP